MLYYEAKDMPELMPELMVGCNGHQGYGQWSYGQWSYGHQVMDIGASLGSQGMVIGVRLR